MKDCAWIRTGRVTALREVVVSRDGSLIRYEVFLVPDGYASSLLLYTLSPWQASLCREAQNTRQRITCGTKTVRWGERILTVTLTPTAAAATQSRDAAGMGDAGEACVVPSGGDSRDNCP